MEFAVPILGEGFGTGNMEKARATDGRAEIHNFWAWADKMGR